MSEFQVEIKRDEGLTRPLLISLTHGGNHWNTLSFTNVSELTAVRDEINAYLTREIDRYIEALQKDDEQ